MIIGKPKVVVCPACFAEHTQMRLISGNTFGATYFSDGNFIAPMLPQVPPYARCSKCDVFYKITNDNTIYDDERSCGEYDDKRSWDELKAIPNVEKLSVRGMTLAINEGLYNGTKKDTLILRIMLWREMNIKRKYHSDEEEALYTDNCRQILSVIQSENDDGSIITKAEIWRNLGDFDKCREVLSQITDGDKYQKYTIAMKKACDRRDTLTIKIGEN